MVNFDEAVDIRTHAKGLSKEEQKLLKNSLFPPSDALTRQTHANPDIHQIGESMPVPIVIKGGSIADLGKSSVAAREDHIHPSYNSSGDVDLRTNGGVVKINGRPAFALTAIGTYTLGASVTLTTTLQTILQTGSIALKSNDIVSFLGILRFQGTAMVGGTYIRTCMTLLSGPGSPTSYSISDIDPGSTSAVADMSYSFQGSDYGIGADGNYNFAMQAQKLNPTAGTYLIQTFSTTMQIRVYSDK